MLYFNESWWEDNELFVSNIVYYNNEPLKAFLNFYLIPWLYEFVEVQISDKPVRVAVRHSID